MLKLCFNKYKQNNHNTGKEKKPYTCTHCWPKHKPGDGNTSSSRQLKSHGSSR